MRKFEVRPSSGKTAPEKRSPGTTIPPGWQTEGKLGVALESLQGLRDLTYQDALPLATRMET